MDENRLNIGEVVGGRWRIDRYIASGGFGQVFAATDISAAAFGPVAVKVLLARASTAERQGFLSEVRHMAALRHANLVSHIDSGLLEQSEQGAVFLVTELCEESLADYVARQPIRRLPEGELAGLVADLSAGLNWLHESGRVHRDLKPANILRLGPVWKLADFGLVRDLSSSGIYHLNTVAGTPRYMAPEFFRGQGVGPATDIWSLGVVVHEVLTGVGVHPGEGPAFIHSLTTTPPTVSLELAAGPAALVRHCVASDPNLRPGAAECPDILANVGGSGARAPTVVSPGGGEAAGATVGVDLAGFAPPPHPPATEQATSRAAMPVGFAPPAAPAPTQQLHGFVTDGEANRGSGRRWLFAGIAGVLALLVGGLVAFSVLTGDDADADAVAGSPSSLDDETAGDGESGDPVAEGGGGDTDDGFGSEADDPEREPENEGTDTDPAGPATAGPFGVEVALNDWTVGECADPTLIDDRFTLGVRWECDAPHQYEVIALIEHPDTGGAFPGDDALFSYGSIECTRAFESRFGVPDQETSLQVVAFRPVESEWNENAFSIVCVVNRGDTQPLDVALGDDVAGWLWKSGDTLNLLELQPGHCFDPVGELDETGFAQRVIYQPCDEPHSGEQFSVELLNDVEAETPGGFPGGAKIMSEASTRCHDELHRLHGDDHSDYGFTSSHVAPTEDEWIDFGVIFAACVVVFDTPTDQTLAELSGT